MAPLRASVQFREAFPDAAAYRVTLYGSLAATGKGHLTETAISGALAPRPVAIDWRPAEELPVHANGMCFEALDASGHVVGRHEAFSVGGGALLSDEQLEPVYPVHTMTDILGSCQERGESFWEYVQRFEGQTLWPFLQQVWTAMSRSIETGLATEGVLPGGLGLHRKAPSFLRKAAMLKRGNVRSEALLAAYAYAVAEENACGGQIVTAPTCGASGVVPAVLYYLKDELQCRPEAILQSLATGGLFGNFVKRHGSICGADVGCQGEIGTACAMAAAAATQLMGGTVRQIEYAAEMGLEHHLGLTCDPVEGLVQIPCIERNAHAATRAMSCCRFALLSDGLHRISYDDVVAVMVETGRALPALYRETSAGGLAQLYRRRLDRQQDGDDPDTTHG
jgi:L-serine dehydratase